MSSYFIERAANAALDDIYAYTFERWGDAQADVYVTGLFEVFSMIVAGTVHARTAPEDFEIDARVCRYKHHYIYWKDLSDGRVGIMAIIHESRHQAARFKEAMSDNR